MMKCFRTIVDIPRADFEINHSNKILFIGSCFAENIGEKLKECKFDIQINPFGILYNPISVKQSLLFLIEKKEFKDVDLDFYLEKWFSFYHHGRFSNRDKSKCLDNINQEITEGIKQIYNADYIFITFGTAYAYKHIEKKIIVANNHKLPANNFERYRLEYEYIVAEYTKTIRLLQSITPKIKIIFTLSPVRHWKDGANGNQISKATLLLAIEKLTQQFNNVSYFPSYEIVLDELRDYRFFDEDMLHPNKITVDYIFERFGETYFSTKTMNINQKVKKIDQAYKHRPFDTNTCQFRKFAQNTLERIKQIKAENNVVNFSEEISYFKQFSKK